MKNQKFKNPVKFPHRMEGLLLEELDFLAKRRKTTRGKLINDAVKNLIKKYKK